MRHSVWRYYWRLIYIYFSRCNMFFVDVGWRHYRKLKITQIDRYATFCLEIPDLCVLILAINLHIFQQMQHVFCRCGLTSFVYSTAKNCTVRTIFLEAVLLEDTYTFNHERVTWRYNKKSGYMNTTEWFWLRTVYVRLRIVHVQTMRTRDQAVYTMRTCD
jgi:hypothetical protein